MRVHLVCFVLFCLQNGSSVLSVELVKEMKQPQTISSQKETFGSATPCDGISKSKFNVTVALTPGESGSLKVTFDYTFEEDFERGQADITWYTKFDEKDTWSIGTALSQNVKCEDIEGKLQSSSFELIDPPSKCPYKKKDRLRGSTTFTDLQQIPFGYNSLIGKMKNSKNHVFLCFNLTIYIPIPPEYDDY